MRISNTSSIRHPFVIVKRVKLSFFFCFQIHGKFILSGTDKEISWNLVHDSKRSENHHSLNFYGREKPNTFSERFFREI